MASSIHNRPRRLFDSRFSYNRRRGSIADEAERAIILRLVDGIPQQYLVLMGTGWRAELTPDERNDIEIKMWYGAIEKMVKNEVTMSELKLKADFYRELWNNLPLIERLFYSRTQWITCQLMDHSTEELSMAFQGFFNGSPVAKALEEKYSNFERRQAREDMLKKAAQQTYFEITQPEAAELLRKRAAEKLVEEAAERAKTAAAVAKQTENCEAAFHVTEEARYEKIKRESGMVAGKGKTPLVWPWEHEAAGKEADCDAMDID